MMDDPDQLVSISPIRQDQQWNEGITKVIDNLSTFGQIRGGRMRSNSIVRKSRNAQLKEHDIKPSALMAMVPSLVMSSIGAGWRPENQENLTPGTLRDPATNDPSRSSAQLFKSGVQVHPETHADDPLVLRYGMQIPVSPVSGGPRTSFSFGSAAERTRHERHPSGGSAKQDHSHLTIPR